MSRRPSPFTSAIVTPLFHPMLSATPARSVMSSKRNLPRLRYSRFGPTFDVKYRSTRPSPSMSPAATMSRERKTLRKGRQYSVKNGVVLAAVLLLVTTGGGCREQQVDQGALLTARTVGLAHLERGRLAEAELEFRKVIALVPKDPFGYTNLGLTYLRGGRFAEAEAQLKRAQRLDARNVDVALLLARLYALTQRPAEARHMLLNA